MLSTYPVQYQQLVGGDIEDHHLTNLAGVRQARDIRKVTVTPAGVNQFYKWLW